MELAAQEALCKPVIAKEARAVLLNEAPNCLSALLNGYGNNGSARFRA